MRTLFALVRSILLALLTPLLEKNAIKTVSIDVPFVFSMSRIIVLAFASGLLHQIWHSGIAGWPEATLSIAIVVALPLLGAMEHLPGEQLIAFSRILFDRFGTGAPRTVASTYSTRPSKFDDHRDDSR